MKKSEAGFTLIEGMLSAFIFTVGALGMLAMFVSGSQGMAVSERMTHATMLARQKLTELSRQPYATVVVGSYTEATNIDELGAAKGTFGATQGDDGWYARSWSVDQPDPAVEFKRIQVIVAWADRALPNARRVILQGGIGQ